MPDSATRMPTSGAAPAATAEVELFRPGTYQASNGTDFEADQETLQGIADRYDPELHEAPVVIGHPSQDAPAYGWVSALTFDGDVLTATLDRIDPAFKELVRDGKYRKVSASFFSPESPANPTPGEPYLRHVGFLGATAPAVPGLKPAEFAAASEAVEIEAPAKALHFAADRAGNESELRALADRLSQRLADVESKLASRDQDFAEVQRERTRSENAEFAERLFREGRLEPGYKAPVVSLLNTLDDAPELTFSEAGETVQRPAKEAFMRFLESRPKVIHFGEFAPTDPAETRRNTTETMAARIAEYQEEQRTKGRALSFADAFEEIKGEFERTP